MTTVKFGYWTVEVDEETTNPLLKHRFYCSECGNWQSYGRTLFCPNCGAKMTMTYGDKIRAMTDEEMVDFLCDMQRRTRYHALTWNEMMEWLQKEISE